MPNPTTLSSNLVRVVHGASDGYSIPLVNISNYSALSVPAWKCAVRFLADNLASFPRSVRMKGTSLDTPHALDVLLKRRPNGIENAYTFWRTWFFHAVHAGDGYARIHRDRSFNAVRLTHLLPENIIPFQIESEPGNEDWQQWYWHRIAKTAFPAADVLHIMQLSHDGMKAMDPISLHEGTLQRATTLETFQVEYLLRGTVIRGVAKFKEALTDAQIAEVRAYLRKFRGGEAEDDVLILTGGGEFENVTTNPQESQLMEQVTYTTKQIAQITGVDPSFMFERSETKYTGTEDAGQNVVRYTFRPWIIQAEAEMTSKLLTEAEQEDGYGIHLNPDALLRGNSKEQMDVVSRGVDSGIYTKNEGREFMGKAPVEDPDANKLKTLGDTAPPKPAA